VIVGLDHVQVATLPALRGGCLGVELLAGLLEAHGLTVPLPSHDEISGTLRRHS
jgi:hypothetical protein